MKKIFILFLIITFFSCDSNERKRPDNLPKTAIWKGGVDGGCWIVFHSLSEKKIDAIVFYENGELWERGTFIKDNNCKTQNITTENIDGFDGEKLITNSGCVFKKKD